MDREATESAGRFTALLARSSTPLMQRVAQLVQVAIAHPVPVLVSGPSGTGKELVARAIHCAGKRRDHPFVAVNCAALAETLLETELFGYRQGAFTGATADRVGLFEAAAGGTLFLDEIGEAPLSLQVKLLRALESGEIIRVGGTSPRVVDVRIIAATHRHLDGEVARGRFRADLYYRINTLAILLPPLAQHPEDIAPLAEHLLTDVGGRLHRTSSRLSQASLACLRRYSWPGNVRELRNEIERAVALAQPGETIEPEHLSAKLRDCRPPAHTPRAAATLHDARCAFEEQYIHDVLQRHHGNAAAAAKTLGISRSMLQRKIRTYSLRAKLAGG